MNPLTILTGHWVEKLKELPENSIQCCVTSPPYWGLRSYLPQNHALKGSELGQEKTPKEYIEKLTTGFCEIWRVIKPDGVLWLNLGDTYAGGGNGGGGSFAKDGIRTAEPGSNKNKAFRHGKRGMVDGCKAKDLIGIPWMAAFALRESGWWLRQDVIWSKPNAMPESVTDRCTRAHEYLFMFTKSARYYYNHEAIKEPPSPAVLKQISEGYDGHATTDFLENGVQDASSTKRRIIDNARKRIDKQRGHSRRHDGFNDRWYHLTKEEQMACGSNKRSVWTVTTASYPGPHFATFPSKLITPCILAGSRPGDTVLDPFGGSGTVGEVSLQLGRNAVLIDLDERNKTLMQQRCGQFQSVML